MFELLVLVYAIGAVATFFGLAICPHRRKDSSERSSSPYGWRRHLGAALDRSARTRARASRRCSTLSEPPYLTGWDLLVEKARRTWRRRPRRRRGRAGGKEPGQPHPARAGTHPRLQPHPRP